MGVIVMLGSNVPIDGRGGGVLVKWFYMIPNTNLKGALSFANIEWAALALSQIYDPNSDTGDIVSDGMCFSIR